MPNHFGTFISSINTQILTEMLKMMRYSLVLIYQNSSYDAQHFVIVHGGHFADQAMHFHWKIHLFNEKNDR